ncbi:ATP-binding protein [uncultured Aquimarina sp.]|uniref:AlbA family DNA-binding domain-containing protein n=1 Tax=uncultured Aquimarina sp. TaxID=575652 RepID=UPI00261AF8D5|nr:ATP-binding protein [uncultured Aquimarina sp.]
MDNTNWNDIIGQKESETLEYKTILPPSKNIAQLIASFANTKGGHIVLGVSDSSGYIEPIGLSNDFRAKAILHKAIDTLIPKPKVDYGYINYEEKSLFAIKIDKAETTVLLDEILYVREDDKTIVKKGTEVTLTLKDYPKLREFSKALDLLKKNATNPKVEFLNHYESILKITNRSKDLLYPDSTDSPTTNPEGKILMRILYSSGIDTFEGYLSDLLYEIYLANPDTLKSEQQVTVKEVLNCTDLEDFVNYIAKKKITKLQRGSVKGFIKDNKEISSLNVLSTNDIDEIEKALQIRHLYAHRNGIIDEKFLKYFPGEFDLNSQHTMSMDEVLTKFEDLAKIVNLIDKESITKYNLSFL